MNYKLYFHTFLVLLSVVAATAAGAQDNHTQFRAAWKHKELIAQNRQHLENELHLVNLSGKSIRLTIHVSPNESVFFTKKLPSMLVLHPGQEKVLLLTGTRTREDHEPSLIWADISTADSGRLQAGFALLSERQTTPVKAVFDRETKYFTALNDTITVPLKMQNYTGQRQSFSYAINDDAGGLEYILEADNPWLEAYESRMFLLKIFRNEKFRDFLNYKMSVEIYGQDKSPVLQSFIPVQGISSFYRMNNPAQANKGELTVEYRSLKDIYQVSDTRYADRVPLGKGNFSFQLRHQYYFRQHISQVFNSYLQWSDESNTVKIGEVYTTGELVTYGNGFYIKHGGKNSVHQVWGTFNSGFIFNSVPVFTRNKKTFGYSFTKERKKSVVQYQAGYIDDVNTGGSGPLAYARQYVNIPGGRLEAGFGSSVEFSKQDRRSRTSMAGELLYRKQLPAWQAEVSARFAGRHYLGQNRGQQSIAARVRHSFRNSNRLFSGYYWQRNNAEYYIGYIPRQYEYHRLFSEYSFVRKNATHTVKAQYQHETLGNFYFTGAGGLSSLLLGYELTGSFKNKHFITLAADVAFQRSAAATVSRFTALRIKSSWRYRGFTSRVTWQSGVFNLNHYSIFRPRGYEQFEWLTQYRVKLRQPRLEANLQFGLYKEDFYKSLRSRVILDLNYHLSPGITLNLGVTKLANFFWQQPEYKIGFVYRPRLLKAIAGKNIRIKAFHDQNGNSRKEEDEPWASGMNIRVAGRMMQTNRDGNIRIAGIRKGNYELHDGNSSRTIAVSKGPELLLPVAVQYTVQGRLIFTGNADTSGPGSRVIYFRTAKAEFMAVTAADGSFSIRLPGGKYHIVIQGAKRIRLNNNNENQLEINENIRELGIRAEAEGRKLSHTVLALALR